MARQMKDSGVEWIGEIPANWIISKTFQVFHELRNKNIGLIETTLLSLSYGKIKQKDINTKEGLLPENFEGYNIIDVNDIVLRLTDLQNDHKSLRVGLCTQKGIITSAYLTLRNYSKNIEKYLYYQLHSFDIAKGFYGMGGGVRQGLNWEGLKNHLLAIPTIAEQQKIATFLDKKCSQIDTALERTRTSIEEYKKLKQAIITKAVTKGVRGDRPMKDSGIEWIGEIPADWKLSRLGLHANIILGKMLCTTQLSSEYTLEKYYSAINVHFDGIDTSKEKYMWFSQDEKKQYLIQNGDLLVVEGGAGSGGCAIADNMDNPVYIQNSLMIVRQNINYDVRYVRYILEHLVCNGYIDFVCNKATIPHFTKEKLSNIPYPVTLFNEQHEIADYLDKKCSAIDTLIAKKNQLITDLESYKKSLIYEYVTGKKEAI